MKECLNSLFNWAIGITVCIGIGLLIYIMILGIQMVNENKEEK